MNLLILDSEPAGREELHSERGSPLVLIGEREHRLYPLAPHKIDYIESEGNYVKYRIANDEYIARESVKRLDAVLRPVGFIRIERSLLLNIRAISYAQPVGHGTFAFTLTSGARLHSGPAPRKRGFAHCRPHGGNTGARDSGARRCDRTRRASGVGALHRPRVRLRHRGQRGKGSQASVG